ncbi:MAG: vanadium-dependent haloperoxidase [Roseivirga sp.]
MTPEETRRQNSLETREEAAKIAFTRNTPAQTQNVNGDEAIARRAMSYTKGLAHDYANGLLQQDADFVQFVQGIDTGDPQDFINTHLGPRPANDWKSPLGQSVDTVRAWESQAAGLTYDLEGPDAQAVAMPPAPNLGSDELTAEMAEVYAQALLRDIPFSVFDRHARSRRADEDKAEKILKILNKLDYFRSGQRNGAPLTLENAFRGFTPGDLAGPYLSQFMLTGNRGLNNRNDSTPEFDASDGMITYGSITIDQRVRRATADLNFMTNWDEWFDVQNGADFRGLEEYRGDARRFITTGRDLSTYVHYDALYEAYLNACLLMLDAPLEGNAPKFDPGVPFQAPDVIDHQQGFANYGGPHILTLVTEVATRALKAVRYQKFNVHRRMRPETLAARMERLNNVKAAIGPGPASDNFQKMYDDLDASGLFDCLRDENECNLLLPMAFREGSPMHPSYGAGHATVAGACVTILKAFFNGNLYLKISEDGDSFSLSEVPADCQYAFVPNNNGRRLRTVESEPLTVNGELNKIAANISIGRDWAGVHYYTDYKESLIMGEEIAIGLLQEQSITYNPLEKLSMGLLKFDGTTVTIKDGQVL